MLCHRMYDTVLAHHRLLLLMQPLAIGDDYGGPSPYFQDSGIPARYAALKTGSIAVAMAKSKQNFVHFATADRMSRLRRRATKESRESNEDGPAISDLLQDADLCSECEVRGAFPMAFGESPSEYEQSPPVHKSIVAILN
jgi:hypothetical protein